MLIVPSIKESLEEGSGAISPFKLVPVRWQRLATE